MCVQMCVCVCVRERETERERERECECVCVRYAVTGIKPVVTRLPAVLQACV